LEDSQGLSHDEATIVAKLQRFGGYLEGALREFSPDFAWLEVSSDAPLIEVGIARSAGSTHSILSAVAASEMGRYVSISETAQTNADFSEAYMSTVRAFGAQTSIRVDIEADLRRSSISVVTASPVALGQARAIVEAVDIDPNVRVAVTSGEISAPTALIKGGKEFTSGTTCTMGFAVTNEGSGSWTQGVLIAAHCSNAASFGGVTLPLRREIKYGAIDAQVHDKTSSNTTSSNITLPNGSGGRFDRTMTGVVTWESTAVGSTVCQVGNAFGIYQCGTVSTKEFSPNWIPNSFNFVKSDGNVCKGDSGGSVYAGTLAYGIVSGGQSNIGTCSNGQTKYNNWVFGSISSQLAALDLALR
jgi:hypothetical protein